MVSQTSQRGAAWTHSKADVLDEVIGQLGLAVLDKVGGTVVNVFDDGAFFQQIEDMILKREEEEVVVFLRLCSTFQPVRRSRLSERTFSGSTK